MPKDRCPPPANLAPHSEACFAQSPVDTTASKLRMSEKGRRNVHQVLWVVMTALGRSGFIELPDVAASKAPVGRRLYSALQASLGGSGL